MTNVIEFVRWPTEQASLNEVFQTSRTNYLVLTFEPQLSHNQKTAVMRMNSDYHFPKQLSDLGPRRNA